MINPGCKINWAANATLRNPKTGIQRLASYDNHKNLKAKRIDNSDKTSIQMSYDLEAPEIEEHLQASMIWTLKKG